MPRYYVCPHGHRWEVESEGPLSASTLPTSCPICGAVPDTVASGDATPLSPASTVPIAPVGESDVPAAPKGVPGYEILGELGRGGMGVVYKARQIALKRVVALKMILGGGVVGADRLVRFRAEAEAVARLQHPNIVQIYEVGEHAGQPFFSLEFVEGGSLAHLLAGMPQSPRVAAALVETLARAVHVAHQHGIVHRDLKPANILLSDERRVMSNKSTAGLPLIAHHSSLMTPKITDFGLAKQLDAESGQTQSGQIMGTPSYMAPEQAAGKIKEIGPATDVHALGAVLYEMLTGRPPFRGTSVLETLELVRSQEPVPPSRLQPKLPRDLETICLKCLEKEAGKRYGSAHDLAEDLGRFLHDRPIHARPASTVDKLRKFTRRNKAVVAGVSGTMLTLLAGLITAVFLMMRANDANAAAQTALLQANDANAAARTAESEARSAEADARREAAQARGHAAKVAAQQGDYRAALDHYNKALELNHPDEIDLRLGRLKCYDALLEPDLYGAEVDALAQRKDLGKYQGMVSLEKARLSIWRRAEYGDAQTLLKQALKEGLPPAEEAVSQAWLAETVPEAVKFLQQASRLDPYNVDARVQLLIFLFLSGRYDELQQTLAQLQILRPNDPLLLLMHAFMTALDGDTAAAEANLDKLAKQGAVDEADMGRFLVRRMMPLLAGDPFADTPNVGLIAFLKDAFPLVMRLQRRYEGKTAGAGLLPLKYVFDSPFSKKLIRHMLAGFSQALFLQYSAAADEIGKMTRINPEGLMFCVHASFLVEAGRLPEAEQALERALQVPSMLRHGRQAALAGVIAVQDREMDAAKGPPDPKLKARLVANLHKLAASTPLGPAGARSMAVVALKSGEYRIALRLLDDCERGGPGNRDLADLRARALLGLGAFEQARATATELLRTQASDKYARQILSTAEARQKNAALSLLAASPADAPDVAKLARQVSLTGAANDANAVSWCPEPTAGQASSLNGQWYFRRSSQKTPHVWTMGTATVLTLGDRVYIEMKDKERRFLLEAQRTDNRLAGRMLSLANATDSMPWVALIVDPERIDGQFGGGRWDLRRRLPEPLTVPPRLEGRK